MNIFIHLSKHLLVVLLLGLVSQGAVAAPPSVSGTLEKGLRILKIEPKKQSNFTVYRGDYVKFRYEEKLGELEFSMPDLKYQDKVQPDPEKSKLFKMTKEGRFPFKLGKLKGELHVIEYQQANYRAITAQEAKELIDTVKPFILDVRTPGEFTQGRIQDAVLLPVSEIQARYGELEQYKNQDIFIYCASGNRSTVAAKVLIDRGFKRIYNLRNGMAEWAGQGLPVEK